MKQLKRIVEASLQAVTLMALLFTVIWTPVVLEQGLESLNTLSYRKAENSVKQVLHLLSINDQLEEEQTESPDDVVVILNFHTFKHFSKVCEVSGTPFPSVAEAGRPRKIPGYLRLRKLLI